MNPKFSREFSAIPSATVDDRATVRLPFVVLEAQVVFPKVVSMVSLIGVDNREAWQYAREKRCTLIAVMATPAQNGSEGGGIYDIGTEIAPGPFIDGSGKDRAALAQGRRRVRIVDFHDLPDVTVAEAFPVADAYPESEALAFAAGSGFEPVQTLQPVRGSGAGTM